jgi:transposase
MRTGRPTKLTPALQATIVLALQSGAYVETAAAFAGVDRQSLFSWMKRGRKQKRGIYHDFLGAVEKAMADAELRDLTVINKAASAGIWQASAWRLERKFPKKWSRRVFVEQPKESKPKAPKVIGFNRPGEPTPPTPEPLY